VTDHKVGSKSKRLPLTDVGNAKRVIAQHGEKLRYCPHWGKWLIWDGKRWAVDEKNEVMGLAKDTAMSLYDEAKICKDVGKRDALFRYARTSQYRRLSAVTKLSGGESA